MKSFLAAVLVSQLFAVSGLALELPEEFTVVQTALFGTKTYQAKADGAKLAEARRRLTIGQPTTYDLYDGTGKPIGRVVPRLFNVGLHLTVSDENGRTVGTLEENEPFKVLYSRNRREFRIYNTKHEPIATSKVLSKWGTDVKVYDANDALVAELECPLWRFVKTECRVKRIGEPVMDSRVLFVLAIVTAEGTHN